MVDIRTLNVGDQVLIRSDLEFASRYDGVLVADGMLKYRGQPVTVSKIILDKDHLSRNGKVDVIIIQEEDEFTFYWSPNMLKPVDNVSLMDILMENIVRR